MENELETPKLRLLMIYFFKSLHYIPLFDHCLNSYQIPFSSLLLRVDFTHMELLLAELGLREIFTTCGFLKNDRNNQKFK